MKHARDLAGDLARPEWHGLSPVAAMVVAALRGWNAGGPGQAMEALRARMTEPRAGAAMAALCDVAGVLGAHRRRPLACHAPGCRHLGGDETRFAGFVECAALGEREAALAMAGLFVEGRAIVSLTDAASRLGLHLHAATLSVYDGCRPAAATLH